MSVKNAVRSSAVAKPPGVLLILLMASSSARNLAAACVSGIFCGEEGKHAVTDDDSPLNRIGKGSAGFTEVSQETQ
jgi:hypothetical protein